MKLLTQSLAIMDIACCDTLLALSANWPSPTILYMALTDIDFINHLSKYSKSYAILEEYS